MANQYTSGWTEEAMRFLDESIGVLSFDKIAKKLGKTPQAVESKIDKLGIGNTKIACGCYTMHELALALCITDKKVKRLIIDKGLPAFQKDYRVSKTGESKRLFYYIDIQKFWKWATANKDLINWYQVPQRSLPCEPEWLKERRKEDYYKWLKRSRPWTNEQDQRLWSLYYLENKSQKEIAEVMSRTVNSVERRLNRLRQQKLNVG